MAVAASVTGTAAVGYSTTRIDPPLAGKLQFYAETNTLSSQEGHEELF